MARKNRFADAVRTPQKRLTPKSSFLKSLERKQEAAKPDPIKQAIDKAAHDLLTDVAQDNQKRRVASLSVAYARRRDK